MASTRHSTNYYKAMEKKTSSIEMSPWKSSNKLPKIMMEQSLLEISSIPYSEPIKFCTDRSAKQNDSFSIIQIQLTDLN